MAAKHRSTPAGLDESLSTEQKTGHSGFSGEHTSLQQSGKPALLHEGDADNWRHVIGVILDDVAFSMMAAIPEMLKVGGGSIVNIASAEAHTIVPRIPAYVASKHALIGLTKATAQDYATFGIRINSGSPDVIRTQLSMAPDQMDVTNQLAARIPQKRLGEPEDIAWTVVFLLSDLCAYTTGTDLVVDGAFLLRE